MLSDGATHCALFAVLQELFSASGMKLRGPVAFRHIYVNMTSVEVQLNSTTKVIACTAHRSSCRLSHVDMTHVLTRPMWRYSSTDH